MRMLLLLALAGCAAAPAEYVRPGESAVAVQMRADDQCSKWLARGVKSGYSVIRHYGAPCAFGWTHNECVCWPREFHNDGINASAGFVGTIVIFSACAELHRRGEL